MDNGNFISQGGDQYVNQQVNHLYYPGGYPAQQYGHFQQAPPPAQQYGQQPPPPLQQHAPWQQYGHIAQTYGQWQPQPPMNGNQAEWDGTQIINPSDLQLPPAGLVYNGMAPLPQYQQQLADQSQQLVAALQQEVAALGEKIHKIKLQYRQAREDHPDSPLPTYLFEQACMSMGRARLQGVLSLENILKRHKNDLSNLLFRLEGGWAMLCQELPLAALAVVDETPAIVANQAPAVIADNTHDPIIIEDDDDDNNTPEVDALTTSSAPLKRKLQLETPPDSPAQASASQPPAKRQKKHPGWMKPTRSAGLMVALGQVDDIQTSNRLEEVFEQRKKDEWHEQLEAQTKEKAAARERKRQLGLKAKKTTKPKNTLPRKRQRAHAAAVPVAEATPQRAASPITSQPAIAIPEFTRVTTPAPEPVKAAAAAKVARRNIGLGTFLAEERATEAELDPELDVDLFGKDADDIEIDFGPEAETAEVKEQMQVEQLKEQEEDHAQLCEDDDKDCAFELDVEAGAPQEVNSDGYDGETAELMLDMFEREKEAVDQESDGEISEEE